jgi:TyrR family helix-turn-helix protein
VRLISATNQDLEERIEEGLFRRDLYYRINVVRIRVPNLNQRKEDISALIKHFLAKYNSKFKVNKTMDDEAISYMCQLDWPGNIRELENMVQRLIISAYGKKITLSDVLMTINSESIENEVMQNPIDGNGSEENNTIDLEQMVNNFEKSILKQACDKYGSTRKTAAAVGISQTQLVRKKKKYDI